MGFLIVDTKTIIIMNAIIIKTKKNIIFIITVITNLYTTVMENTF